MQLPHPPSFKLADTATIENHSSPLSVEATQSLLGIRENVALSRQGMLAKLRVCFFPAKGLTPRLTVFLSRLRHGFEKLGIKVLEFEDALAQGRNGKVEKGIVIIAAGDLTEGQLPIDFVPSLSENITVGIYDRPSPLKEHTNQQARIDLVMGDMVWDVVQVVIYLEDETWTVCNPNGAMVPLLNRDDLSAEILQVLLSKLAAPVVPPRITDFEVRSCSFDPSHQTCLAAVHDLVNSGKIWDETGLFIFHSTFSGLKFRNKFYRRLATAFVDSRTGMSYGFLVRQLPMTIQPVLTVQEAVAEFGEQDWQSNDVINFNGRSFVCVNIMDNRWVLSVPDVWVLCTRSGCVKTSLDARRDILRLGLSKGRFILETPRDLPPEADCKPSYDSSVIVAHALGNSFVASFLARFRPDSEFLRLLQSDGLALAHWHDYLPDGGKIALWSAYYNCFHGASKLLTETSEVLRVDLPALEKTVKDERKQFWKEKQAKAKERAKNGAA